MSVLELAVRVLLRLVATELLELGHVFMVLVGLLLETRGQLVSDGIGVLVMHDVHVGVGSIAGHQECPLEGVLGGREGLARSALDLGSGSAGGRTQGGVTTLGRDGGNDHGADRAGQGQCAN